MFLDREDSARVTADPISERTTLSLEVTIYAGQRVHFLGSALTP